MTTSSGAVAPKLCTCSPRPRQTAAPCAKKNGTSLPNSAASSANWARDQPIPHTWLPSSSAVAASLDPPPSPAALGIRFTSSTFAPNSQPLRSRSNSNARTTKLRESVGISAVAAEPRTVSLNRARVPSSWHNRNHRQRIVEVDRHHERLELVVTVLAPVENVEKEIQLGGRVASPLLFVLAEVHPTHHNKTRSNSHNLYPANSIISAPTFLAFVRILGE